MRRRDFIAGTAALAAVSRAVAQQRGKMQRLAVFSPFQPVADMQENSSNRYYRTIVAELRRLGHIEGKNLMVGRFGREQNAAGLDAEAAQVVGSSPDVVLAIGPDAAAELKAATTTIPIVTFTGDPIALGLTKSLT